MKLLPTYQEDPLQHRLVYSTLNADLVINMADPDLNNVMASSFRMPQEAGFEFSDLFQFTDWIDDEEPVLDYNPQNPNCSPSEMMVNSTGISISSSNSFHEGTVNKSGSGSGREKKEIKEKVAFKTKSEVEVLDDGFKWRKYGKKKVKNSPNPRNYYKCSVEGCQVKKRVERDKEDSNYVVTTYEGIHTHQGPHL